jgi:hypothetical protein
LNIDYDALDSDEENFPHAQQQNPNDERPVPSPSSLALQPEDNPAERLPNNPQDSVPELSRLTRTQPPGCTKQRPSTSSRTQPILSNCSLAEVRSGSSDPYFLLPFQLININSHQIIYHSQLKLSWNVTTGENLVVTLPGFKFRQIVSKA